MATKKNLPATTTEPKNEKDEKILAALIASPTIRAASEACGISETVIYGRLRDDVFRQRYDAARLELLDAATATLQKKITAAIDVISEIAEDAETAPQIRLNAATAILQNAVKLTEYGVNMKAQQQRDAARNIAETVGNMTRDELDDLQKKIKSGGATVKEIEMCSAATSRIDTAESFMSDAAFHSFTNIY